MLTAVLPDCALAGETRSSISVSVTVANACTVTRTGANIIESRCIFPLPATVSASEPTIADSEAAIGRPIIVVTY